MDSKKLIIEKDKLIKNINTVKTTVGNKVIAVIKGNGYGLGLLEIAGVLSDEGISCFAVSEISEALALRENGFEQEILLLSPVILDEDIKNLIEKDITLTVSSLNNAKAYGKNAFALKKNVKTHIKVDTGFGRFGFTIENKEEIPKVYKIENLIVHGIYSHFSCSFEKKYDITKNQFNQFTAVIEYLKSLGLDTGIKHIANSYAALRFPETRLDAVRVGSAFLGRLNIKDIKLEKIAYLKSNVITIRELPAGHNIGYGNTFKTKYKTKIGVIPVGYIDGYMVEKSNDTFRFIDILRYMYNDLKSFNHKAYVYISDKPYRVLGRVGMYNIIIDVTNSDVKENDEVILPINPLFVDQNIEKKYI